ncbi:MAG: hypothetical protein K2N72_11650 [Oscillospiraceae bacterium]|nr:hypothetical protein [Oscillospiraceae bacterium]
MFKNEFTNKINEEYKSAYHSLNKRCKECVTGKKYFTGSYDELGYYQPDLTDIFKDEKSRQGRFMEAPSAKRSYFEYWYKGDELIKIKFISNKNDDECYDVIIENFNRDRVYLFYKPDYDGIVSLSHFYVLKYNESSELISLNKYIDKEIDGKYDLICSEYFYSCGRLVKAVVCDGFREEIFDFFYGNSGQLMGVTLNDGRHRYDLNIEGKAEKMREFGAECFGDKEII